MGFYGRVIQGSSQNLQFDRTYPNKYIMDANCEYDNIFIGRRVMIDYNVGNGKGLRYQQQNDNNFWGIMYNLDNNTRMILYIKESAQNGKKEIVFEETEKATNMDMPDGAKEYPSIFDLNQAIDKVQDKTLGRGYDNTAWQKTQIESEIKYIHIADLNSVVPEIEFLQDPPTSVPMKPHYDEDNTNVKYTLHTQPTWGFRIAKSGKFIELKKTDSVKFVENFYYQFDEDTEYSLISKDNWDTITNNTIIYYQQASDETIAPWEKIEVNISNDENYNKTYSKTTYYANDFKNANKILNDKSEEPEQVSIPNWTENIPEGSGIQAAIYYNKAGFDKATKSHVSGVQDSIKITPAYSGNYYNTVPSKGPGGEELYEDVQELSINLPSIGNAISDVWDEVYGPNRSFATDENSTNIDDQNSLMGLKKKINNKLDEIYDTYATKEELQDLSKEVFDEISATDSGNNMLVLDNISPVEHKMDVEVSSKNLFDISKITTTTQSNEDCWISEVGTDYFVITTPDNYPDNGFCTTKLKLRELCPTLKVGDIVVLSMDRKFSDGEENYYYVYLSKSEKLWGGSGRSVTTITEKDLDSTFIVYGSKNSKATAKIQKIQIEKSTVATDYTPYVNVEGVKLYKNGKNLFNIDKAENGGIDSDGEANENLNRIHTDFIYLPAGTYSMSTSKNIKFGRLHKYKYASENDDSYKGYESTILNEATIDPLTKKVVTTYTLSENCWVRIVLLPIDENKIEDLSKDTVLKYCSDLQIEVGEKATEYEPYIDLAKYSVPLNGIVEEVTSLYPTTTLYTNTENVLIEAKYLTVNYNDVIDEHIDNKIGELNIRKGANNGIEHGRAINTSQLGAAFNNSYSGALGYYYRAIDFNYKRIYLSKNKKDIPTLIDNEDISSQYYEKDGWEDFSWSVGDEIVIHINNKVSATYLKDDSIKIKKIDNNVIEFSSKYALPSDFVPTAINSELTTPQAFCVWNLTHPQREGTMHIGVYGFSINSGMALADNTFAQGYASAVGKYSAAFGEKTQAKGYASFAEGGYAQAVGTGTHAEGAYTIAYPNYQHAQGLANIIDSSKSFVHVVGNGKVVQDIIERSNAYALDWNGNGYFAGNVYAGVEKTEYENATCDEAKQLVTKGYVDDRIDEINVSGDSIKAIKYEDLYFCPKDENDEVWTKLHEDDYLYYLNTEKTIEFTSKEACENFRKNSTILVQPVQGCAPIVRYHVINNQYGYFEKSDDEMRLNLYLGYVADQSEDWPYPEIHVDITIIPCVIMA